MKKEVFVYLSLVIAMVFWGFSFIWTKIALDVYKPITIVFLRLIIAAGFMWILGFSFGKIQKLSRKDMKNIMFLALFEPFLYFVGENNGLEYVSSTVASVVISLIPLVTPIAAYISLHQRISLMNLLGIFISILGVILVIVKEDLTLSASPKGLILLMVAILSAVGYSVLVMRLSGKYNVFTIITWQNTLGVIYFAPIFFLFEFNHFSQTQFQWSIFFPIIKLAIFASSLAFMLYTYGIQIIGLSKANSFTNIIPVCTCFFAYMLMGEKFVFINLIGIIIVIAGLFLSQIQLKPTFTFRRRYVRLRRRFSFR